MRALFVELPAFERHRAPFATILRTNPRTVENREQGRARLNAQVALLIRMVERHPNTVKRLVSI